MEPVTELACACTNTSLGRMMLATTPRGLCSLQVGSTAKQLLDGLQREFPAAALKQTPPSAHPQLQAWMEALSTFLQGQSAFPVLPLDMRGTDFQIAVWNQLRDIPAGQTASYARVAQALGRPRAARAVAGACARNHIAVVIPCHRVIRGDGGLGGYRWGLERKRTLLTLESRRCCG